MKTNQIIIMISVALVAGAVAFFGGIKYEQYKSVTADSQYAQGMFVRGRNGSRLGNARFGNRNRKGAIIGQIVSSDANSITVKMNDGSSKIINLSGNTKVIKTDTASKSDLTNGTTVAVFGVTNSDGSISADNIELNPTQFFKGAKPSGMPTKTQ